MKLLKNTSSDDMALFSNSSENLPEPVLTFQQPLQRFAEIADELELRPTNEYGNSAGLVHLVCTAAELCHKEKAIRLFAFAIIVRLKFNSNSKLWEYSKFKKHLVDNIDKMSSLNLVLEDQFTSPIVLKPGLELSPVMQLHLRQAGFEIAAGDHDLVLDETALTKLIATSDDPRLKVSA